MGASRKAYLASLVLPAHDLCFSSILAPQLSTALYFCVGYHTPTSAHIAPHRKQPFFLLISSRHSLAYAPKTLILFCLTYCFVTASMYTLFPYRSSVFRSHSACFGVSVKCSFSSSDGPFPHLLPPSLCCVVQIVGASVSPLHAFSIFFPLPGRMLVLASKANACILLHSLRSPSPDPTPTECWLGSRTQCVLGPL